MNYRIWDLKMSDLKEIKGQWNQKRYTRAIKQILINY